MRESLGGRRGGGLPIGAVASVLYAVGLGEFATLFRAICWPRRWRRTVPLVVADDHSYRQLHVNSMLQL